MCNVCCIDGAAVVPVMVGSANDHAVSPLGADTQVKGDMGDVTVSAFNTDDRPDDGNNK